tara:strand:- start:96 stop:443 length:348 start_codon:yes stop_codon:yes gene_type:complete
MIPLSSDLLNSPERILDELVQIKHRINTLKTVECALKDELEQHLKDGKIKGIFKSKGITANRLQTKQNYLFSEQLRNLEDNYKAEIEKKKELEILDEKYTKRLETRPFWRISVDK